MSHKWRVSRAIPFSCSIL